VPELPDVEGYRRYFARHARGRRIESVSVADPDLLRNATPRRLDRALAGRRFSQPDRHGKWLIAPTDGPEVLMHFGMTGMLSWSSNPADPHPHDRVAFELDGGVLRYRDMRKFGGVWLATSGRARDRITGPLGPDAMQITGPALAERLGLRRGRIKPVLMDQRVIAGLGNLLSDEILWRARINPSCAAARLSSRRMARLHRCMRAVLRESNRHARVPPAPGWLTRARAEREPRCPRCGAALSRATIGGRTTVWCARCQRS
jgi:formamidopyrimidine-DNA glycosylase